MLALIEFAFVMCLMFGMIVGYVIAQIEFAWKRERQQRKRAKIIAEAKLHPFPSGSREDKKRDN